MPEPLDLSLRNALHGGPEVPLKGSQLELWAHDDLATLHARNRHDATRIAAEEEAYREIMLRRAYADLIEIVNATGVEGVDNLSIREVPPSEILTDCFRFVITDLESRGKTSDRLTQLADAMRAQNGPLEDNIPTFGIWHVHGPLSNGEITVQIPIDCQKKSPAAESPLPSAAEIEEARQEVHRRMGAAREIIQEVIIEKAWRTLQALLDQTETVKQAEEDPWGKITHFIKEWLTVDASGYRVIFNLDFPNQELQAADALRQELQAICKEVLGPESKISPIYENITTAPKSGIPRVTINISDGLIKAVEQAGLI